MTNRYNGYTTDIKENREKAPDTQSDSERVFEIAAQLLDEYREDFLELAK